MNYVNNYTFLIPYLDRRVFRFRTGSRSYFPRITLYRTLGKSRALPPRTKTTEILVNYDLHLEYML